MPKPKERVMRHSEDITLGIRGEISKIDEEVAELKDVQNISGGFWASIIECADIVESVGQFSWKKYCVPLPFVFLLVVVRWPYKRLRNLILDLLGRPKESFFCRKSENPISRERADV